MKNYNPIIKPKLTSVIFLRAETPKDIELSLGLRTIVLLLMSLSNLLTDLRIEACI